MERKWIAVLMAGSLLTGAGSTYAGMQWYENKAGVLERQIVPFKDHARAESGEQDSLEKVEQAYSLIFNSYVEKVEDKKLVEGAIKGMLSTLEDPYSVYMDKETAREFNQTLESSFEGIGAEVSTVDGKIVIVSPFKNSPAEKAGLKPNDQILKVDGESIEGLDLFEATTKIRGKKGTPVVLEIGRKGLKDPLQVKVIRDEIPQITVYRDMKKVNGENVGYLEITSFSEDTSKEFKKELKALEKEGLDALLIDVRGNPGGLLTSVEEILRELIPKDKPLYQIEERSGDKTRYFSNLDKAKAYPIGVLTNDGSASAAEILAGALKEAGGYPVIGEKSFGKGTVQQAVPMGDGSNIKLTLFKWLTPDGNWIHKKGIEPTVEVNQPALYHTHPIQVDKPLRLDMNNEQIKNAQEILAGLGFEPGRTDGYFSNQTEIAVRVFQRNKSMNVTGVIDAKTATALEEAAREAMKQQENDLQLQTALRLLAR
ncbi:S41 family peptidase [Mesobacillus thioparans]|uniref:S41 family peptidase n=1 Tax=Mesobacillus thioparans TaxID=370439 RepID=UPI0039EE464A